MDTSCYDELEMVEPIIAEEEDDEMPTLLHGWLQLRLLTIFARMLTPDCMAVPPVTFQGVERRFIPDVSVYRKQIPTPISEQVAEEIPPLLAIEIISPGQTMIDMVLKCQAMIASGVQECWIVEPANETVTVCRAEHRFALHAGEMLTNDLLKEPLRVDDIFRAEL